MADLLPPAENDLVSPEEPVKPTPSRRRIPLPPGPIRWLFRRWWGLAGTIGALVLGDLLGVPLANSPEHYWDGVKNQFGELITIVTTDRWQSAVAAVAVIVFTIFGYIENKRVRDEERQQIQGEIGKVSVEATVRTIAPMQEDLSVIKAAFERITQQAADTSLELAGASGLPLPTQFVGREAEKVQIRQSLTAGESVGLCALAGMGGIGKSALAAVMVNELSRDLAAFPGGSAWISCDGLIGEEGLAELWSRTARELRLTEIASEPNTESRRIKLAQALYGRPLTLLALDNIEFGLNADVVLNTVAVPGHTAVLLTSREQIAPHRLQMLELPPLPDPEAEKLFRVRLAQRNPTRPTAEDESHIPALVEAVGGLPLAVELLAAYGAANKLGLHNLKEELTRNGINAAAFRAEPERVLTINFDRSYALLNKRQQRLLAGLSILARSSFPREVALTLGNVTNVPNEAEKADPEGDLATLVYCSLVEALEGGRLRLHPMLREYATRQLTSMEHQGATLKVRLGEAMVAWWLTFAQAHPGSDGMLALEAEADGLMGALTWAYDQKRNKDVLALAHALGYYWYHRGRIDEARLGRPWALAAAKSLNNHAEQRFAQHELALLRAKTGQVKQARTGYKRALALAEQLGDLSAQREEIHGLAVLSAQANDVKQARTGYKHALALAEQLNDLNAQRIEIHSLAELDARARQMPRAREGFERALALAKQLGDLSAQSLEWRSLGVNDLKVSEYVRARSELEQSLALARLVKQPTRIAKAAEWLAELDRQEDHYSAACSGFHEALSIYMQIGSPETEPIRQKLQEIGCDV